MDAKFGIIGLVVCVLCALGLGSRAAWAVPTPTGDPFTSIEGNMRYQVGELQGRTPQGTPSSWRTARQALDLGTHTLAYTGIPLAQAHDRIHALSKQNLLAWEAALIAQTHAAGGLSADLAAAWVRFLSAWDALPEAERIQQHTALRLRLIGGAPASLAPACMPTAVPAGDQGAAPHALAAWPGRGRARSARAGWPAHGAAGGRICRRARADRSRHPRTAIALTHGATSGTPRAPLGARSDSSQ